MKAAAVLALKVIALGFIMFLFFLVPAPLLAGGTQPAPAQVSLLGTVFAVHFLFAVVLSYLILRSRWSGLKLIAAVFVVFYGIATVLSQVETAYFIRWAPLLPPGMLPKLFLTGAITAGLWSMVAVPVLGKFKPKATEQAENRRLVMPPAEWVWKAAAIMLLYLLLYFGFGYFVAWQNPELRSYYGGLAAAGSPPGLIALQLLRALMWGAMAVLAVRQMKGRWWEAALAVSLLFSVLMGFQLLIPNPYMPDSVRMSHFVEVSSSNFLFGWLTVSLLGLRGRIPAE